MTITFNNVPAGLLVPFVAVEFDSSRATSGLSAAQKYVGLLVGQMTDEGEATAGEMVQIASASQATRLFGTGSQLASMCAAWLAKNQVNELWAFPMDDPYGGVAAEATVTFVGTATSAGTFHYRIAGRHVRVPVAIGDTETDVAQAMEDTVVADHAQALFTANAVAGVVTLTARNAGLCGIDLPIRGAFAQGEADQAPTGLTSTIAVFQNGTGQLDTVDLVEAMGDEQYNVIVIDRTIDPTALSAELADRCGPLRPLDGLAIAGSPARQYVGHADLLTSYLTDPIGLGTVNSPHLVWIATGGSPSVPWEVAAEIGAIVAQRAEIDPARGHTGVPISALSPDLVYRLRILERNQLLGHGYATIRPGGAGMQIERLVTTYQTDGNGNPDIAYRDLATMLTLSYLRYSFRQLWSGYSDYKLADDGTNIGAGQAVMTPSVAYAIDVAWAQQMEIKGLIEGADKFAAALVVERNGSDPNRLDHLLPPDLMNQLIVTAAKIQYVL